MPDYVGQFKAFQFYQRVSLLDGGDGCVEASLHLLLVLWAVKSGSLGMIWIFNGSQMEDSVVPWGLKACLLKNSLLGGGPPLSCILKIVHYFLATIIYNDSDFSNICFHVCNVSFFSGHSQDFFSLHLIFSSLTVIYLCVVYFHLCSDWGSLRLVRASLLEQW